MLIKTHSNNEKIREKFIFQATQLNHLKRRVCALTLKDLPEKPEIKIKDVGLLTSVYIVTIKSGNFIIDLSFIDNDYEIKGDCEIIYREELTLVDCDISFQGEYSLYTFSGETWGKLYNLFIEQLVTYINQLGLIEEIDIKELDNE